MSITTCAFSGQALIEPVVSTKSGHIFEKSVILKQISATGQCPCTAVTLKESDLVDIQCARAAAPQLGSSIPQILQSAANEYDRLLKEIFDLKQALHKTRQELSMALHKGQSAVNTVCRLQAENEKLTLQIASNDDLVERLESKIDQMTVSQKGKETEMKGLRQAYEEALTTQKSDQQMTGMEQQESAKNIGSESNGCGFNQEISAYFHEHFQELVAARKKDKAPTNYLKKTDLKLSKGTTMKNFDSAMVSMDQLKEQIVVSQANKKQVIRQFNEEKPIDTITNEQGFARLMPFSNLMVVFNNGAQNKNTKVINLQTKETVYEITCHTAVILSASSHAIGRFLAVGSSDGSWSLHDVEKKQLVYKIQINEPVTAIEFHPDGLVISVGLASGTVKLFDVRSQEVAHELPKPDNQAGAVKKIGFSNKGIHMAVIWDKCAICRIFSLHKGCEATNVECSKPITAFTFDIHGQFLFTADSEKLYAFYYKDFSTPLRTYESKGVKALACDNACSQIYSIHDKQIEIVQTSESK